MDDADIDGAAALPALHDERVQRHVRVRGAVQGAGAELLDDLVEALGEPRDLALGHPLHPELLHELLHPPGRHAGEVGVGDHRHERLLRTPARLQQPIREVRALPELRHRELDRPDPRIPRPLPVPVTAVDPLKAPLTPPGTANRVGVRAHHPLGHLLHHRPQQIRARLLKLLAQPDRNVHRVLDHRAPPLRVSLTDLARMTRWSATTRTPPPLLRARLRLALHSSGGKNENRLVHHALGR